MMIRPYTRARVQTTDVYGDKKVQAQQIFVSADDRYFIEKRQQGRKFHREVRKIEFNGNYGYEEMEVQA